MGDIGVVHDAMQNESSKIWIRQKSRQINLPKNRCGCARVVLGWFLWGGATPLLGRRFRLVSKIILSR